VASGRPAAAKVEDSPGVGSIGPAASKAEASSRRGERQASSGRGGGDFQAMEQLESAAHGGQAAELWGYAEKPHRQWGTAAAEAHRRTAAAAGKPYRQERNAMGAGYRFTFSFLFSLFLTTSIPEWQYAVIRSNGRGTCGNRFDPLRRSSGNWQESALDQFLAIHRNWA
jgi:hypothetical protein